MPYGFSDISLQRLGTADERLQQLADAVLQLKDHSILSGRRTLATQRVLVAEGYSRTLKSKHLHTPSLAIDIAPYFAEEPHWRWPQRASDDERPIIMAEWAFLAGLYRGMALAMGLDVIVGCDWNDDGYVSDERFQDWGHVELQE